MTHGEFNFSIFILEDALEEFSREHCDDINVKELRFLIMAYYNGIVSTKDFKYTQAMFKRLIDARLFFKIKEDGATFVCSINSAGILLINKLFEFLNDKYREYYGTLDINKKTIQKIFLARGKPLKKNLLSSFEV